jgi:hypothetical protein
MSAVIEQADVFGARHDVSCPGAGPPPPHDGMHTGNAGSGTRAC